MHPIHKYIDLCVHVHGVRYDARCEMSRMDRNLERYLLLLRWLKGQTKVIRDSFQGGQRVLVHNKLTKSLFLGYSGIIRKEEVDLRLRRLEKSRGDSDVDFSEPSISRQSIRTFS